MANEQEELIKRQFAETRRGLEGEKRRALQNYEDQFKRFSAANRLEGSGALLKAKGRQIEDIGRTFGETEAGIGAQEAQALQAAKEAQEAKEFATSERIGSQQFAGQESEKARAMAMDQFNKQFKEMQNQWNLEFDENKKTNIINAAIALNDAGLADGDRWAKLLGSSGAIGGIYGSRAPIIRPRTPVRQPAQQAPASGRPRIPGELFAR